MIKCMPQEYDTSIQCAPFNHIRFSCFLVQLSIYPSPYTTSPRCNHSVRSRLQYFTLRFSVQFQICFLKIIPLCFYRSYLTIWDKNKMCVFIPLWMCVHRGGRPLILLGASFAMTKWHKTQVWHLDKMHIINVAHSLYTLSMCAISIATL